MARPDFERIAWNPEGFTIGPWDFRTYPEVESDLPSGTDPWFWFFKPRSMVEDYIDMFAKHPQLSVDRALELGIWDGGSVAFWSLLTDARMAAVDLSRRGDSTYFSRFASERTSVRTLWNTNQTDEAALKNLLTTHLLTPLDLVIDDASHYYLPTRRSFEILFPCVRPGGLYVIEDWQWSFEPLEQSGTSRNATKRPLVDLIHDLLAVMGSNPGLIRKIDVYPLFVVVERGDGVPEDLRLDAVTHRRARPTLLRRAAQGWSGLRRVYWHLKSRIK
jgi:hypothetical protein